VTRARTRARLAAALAPLVLLAGCTGSPAPDAGPEATPEPSHLATLRLDGAYGIRDAGATARSGEAELSYVPPLAEVVSEPDEDGAVVLTLGLPKGGGGNASTFEALSLVAPEGMTLERLEDGSAVLRTGDERVVGAVTPPVLGGAATGSGIRVQQAADRTDPAVLTWVVTLPVLTDGTVEDPPGGTVSATFAGSAVRDATWRDLAEEGGRSLAVVPADWARGGGLAAEELVWAQLTAQQPEADVPTVRDQLSCHLIGAPDKASWNLEPWRPDVGLLRMIGALCNPE
jgi:hypothetical protein